jgi:ElaB/YqjD/DUF883 family membrane-anchored ribosome-binding protein
MRSVLAGLLVIAAVIAAPIRAQQPQSPVTATDLGRLDATIVDIERQLATLKKSDPTLAGEVERALNDLRDEAAYLRVKLKREGSVTRKEYDSARDRLETLRLRSYGQKVAAQPAGEDPLVTVYTIAVGTEFDTRLQTPLNSGKVRAEERFEATTMLDYLIGKDIVVPAGTTVRGFVSSVQAAGRIDRKGSMTLSFDEIRIGNRSYKLRASVVNTLDPKVAEDVTRIGTGAAVGAVIGGLLGGGKGALIGVFVGGGSTVAATEGSDVNLPVGTILRIRVDQPLSVPKEKG